MSFPPISYVAAAVAYLMVSSAEHDEYFSYPATEEAFAAAFGHNYNGNIDHAEAAAAIGLLSEVGLISFDEDEFAGRFLKVDAGSFRQRWDELAANALDSPFGKADQYGKEWLQSVFNNTKFWERIRESDPNAAPFLLPGGMLRRPEPVVYIVEGSAETAELKEGLENIAEALRTNNEIGSELGEERPRIMSEVKASQDLIASGTVRVGAIREVLIKVLRELARKLKDKAVDLGVDKLLALAIKLIE